MNFGGDHLTGHMETRHLKGYNQLNEAKYPNWKKIVKTVQCSI